MRRYPIVVPQRLAKARCSVVGNPFKKLRSAFMRAILPVGNLWAIPTEHLPFGIPWHDARVDDLSDIRQQRLRQLLDEPRFGGKQSVFAEVIGRSPDYVSRMLSHGKNRKRIGEKLAREIEQKVGKPRGWLDVAESAEECAPPTLGLSPQAEAVARKWEQLPEPVRSQLAILINSLVDQYVRPIERPRHNRPTTTARRSKTAR